MRPTEAVSHLSYSEADAYAGCADSRLPTEQEWERAAGEYLTKAARKNSAPAQSRLALMYALGKGIKADPVEAARWHLIAKAGGANDQYLDDYVRKLKPADRTAGEDKAKPWIARMKVAGPSPFPDPEPPKQ